MPRLLPLPIRGLFLHSPAARRVFLLFLLAAAVPVLILGLLLGVYAHGKEEEAAQERLAHEAGAYASRLSEHLLQAQRLLSAQAAAWNAQALAEALPAWASELFVRIDPVVPAAEQPAQDLIHLARGASLLRAHGGHGAARLELRQAREATEPGGTQLRAELEPVHLWGQFPGSMQACVLDAHGQVLHCSQAALVPVAAAIAGQLSRHASGESGDWQYSARPLALQARFAAGDWTVLALRPRRAAALEAGALGAFGAVLLLAVAFAGVLSAVQRRHTVEPLERLIEGTRRFARGDFYLPMEVEREDAFGQLAHALNRMAAQLGRQMGTLRVLSEIDHEILVRADMERVIARVQERLHELWPQAVTSMVVFDRQAADFGIVHLYAGQDEVAAKLPSRLEPWLLERLARDYDGMWFDVGGADLPDFLSMVANAGARRILVLPIFWRKQVSGLLAIGLMEARGFRNELVQQARDLVNRIGVALAAHARDEQLKYHAYHDDLTGLPNRPLLLERLGQEMSHARRNGKLLAVLFIDLDRFKKVNDSLGHEAGDRLLRQVAERLLSATREGDTVARLSGDEFVVLLPGLGHPKQAARLAGEMVGLLGEPFMLDDTAAYVGASVGVAIFPDDGNLAAELLKKADMAMYRAKATGRGRVIFFEESMNRSQQEQSVLERELRVAIPRGQLSLHYQPRIQLGDGRLTGAEALLRWQHPELGWVSPERFIPLAEEAGLIDELGDWVLREVCAQLGRWQSTGHPIRVSVNVSGRQLRSGRLRESLERALAGGDVASAALEIEISEGSLGGDIEAVGEQLARIRETGVRIALDGFGAGPSWLHGLQRLPFDVLKIDRSFTRELGQDDGAGSIVHSLITLAHSLGKTVVAAGVEHERQAELLAIWRCEQAQGHYYSQPLTAAEFEELLLPSRPAEIV